jgi:hypothetical protein
VFGSGSAPWATGLTSDHDVLLKHVSGSPRAALVHRNRITGEVHVRNALSNTFASPRRWLTGMFGNFELLETRPQSIH